MTPNKTKVEVNFCFQQMDYPQGRFVPYKVEPDGRLWGNSSYSTEVTSYTGRVTRDFRLTQADEEWADSRYWPAVWKRIKEASQWIFGGWLALWIFTAVVGWIVRGFAGIPTGQDHRPEVPD